MINGVVIREQDAFTDYRGDLFTTWKENDFDLKFNHDKVSTSRKNVLRGIHFQFKNPQYQIFYLVKGELDVYFVDFRPRSKTFLNNININLKANNKHIVAILC